jgi:hypothetical protein
VRFFLGGVPYVDRKAQSESYDGHY